jgi:hypothetical protein
METSARPRALLGLVVGVFLILQFLFEFTAPWPILRRVEPSPVALGFGLLLALASIAMMARFGPATHVTSAAVLGAGSVWMVLPSPGEPWRFSWYTVVGLLLAGMAVQEIRRYAGYRRKLGGAFRVERAALQSVRRSLRACRSEGGLQLCPGDDLPESLALFVDAERDEILCATRDEVEILQTTVVIRGSERALDGRAREIIDRWLRGHHG